MNISQIYILIAIAVLLIIAVLLFFVKKNKKEKRFTPLAGSSLAFVIAGILFGDENRMIGYSLMAIGIIIAVLDIIIIKKGKKKQK